VSAFLRFNGAVAHEPQIDRWFDVRSPGLGEIARTWFSEMRRCGADVTELLHDGHPTACVADAAFGYVNVFSAHVNVGFFHGAALPDPGGILEGDGRFMRHVKVRPGVPLDASSLKTMIEAAYADIRARLMAEQAAQ